MYNFRVARGSDSLGAARLAAIPHNELLSLSFGTSNAKYVHKIIQMQRSPFICMLSLTQMHSNECVLGALGAGAGAHDTIADSSRQQSTINTAARPANYE